MKQSELDLAMNEVLDTIFNLKIDEISKMELLKNIKHFFVEYDKIVGGVQQDKIETIDFRKVK